MGRRGLPDLVFYLAGVDVAAGDRYGKQPSAAEAPRFSMWQENCDGIRSQEPRSRSTCYLGYPERSMRHRILRSCRGRHDRSEPREIHLVRRGVAESLMNAPTVVQLDNRTPILPTRVSFSTAGTVGMGSQYTFSER